MQGLKCKGCCGGGVLSGWWWIEWVVLDRSRWWKEMYNDNRSILLLHNLFLGFDSYLAGCLSHPGIVVVRVVWAHPGARGWGIDEGLMIISYRS